MSEKLEIYNMNSKLINLQDRKEFYDEIKKEFEATGKITKKVKTIRLILMNSLWRIYLQKRSKTKAENPNKYDKSVGGHVVAWDSYDLTVSKECAEELWFPATILTTEEFNNAITTTKIDIIWIFKKIDYLENFQSERTLNNWKHIIQPQMTSLYVWYYDWAIKFVDGESSGIEVFSLEELEEEIVSNPDKFTKDIQFMIDNYKQHLIPISK